MTVIVYPRLYTSRHSEGDDVIVSSGDQTVELLYSMFVNHTTNVEGWDFRKQVLLSALRLFGDFHLWVGQQNHNPNIVGYNKEFIKDTLNFIRHGTRELSIHTWFDMVADGGDSHQAHLVPKKLIEAPLTVHVGEVSIETLQSWVSKTNGLEDLLLSLHLLFGAARKA